MTFTELIARVALAEAKEPGRLGVRLSPVDLTPDEGVDLVERVRVGGMGKIFVAISVPGVEFARPDGRSCLSDDDRAAQLATSWRNKVRVEAGERVVYVSVRPHGRAGGLRDALVPLSEDSLVAFMLSAACADALPEGFGRAAARSDLPHRVRPRQLCAFAARVGRDWARAAGSLPMLGLARDGFLANGPGAADVRLSANVAIVAAAEADEARYLRLHKNAVAVADRLAQQARTSDGLTEDALTEADLGKLPSEQLVATIRKPADPGPGPSAAVSSTRSKPDRRKEVATVARGAHAPVPGPSGLVEPSAPLPDRGADEPKIFLDDGQRPLIEVLEADAASDPTQAPAAPPTPGSPSLPAMGAGSTRLERDALHAAPSGATAADEPAADEPTSPRVVPRPRLPGQPLDLPVGLAGLLDALHASPGWGLHWGIYRGAKRTFLDARLPKSLEDPSAITTEWACADQRGLVAQWEGARAALLAAIGPTNVPRFLGAPASALSDPELRRHGVALVGAAHDALRSGSEQGGPEDLAALLARDTVQVSDVDDRRLVVLSPVHPLVIEHALRASEERDDLSGASLRWWSWLDEHGRLAPATLRTVGGQLLQRGHDVGGLPLYETTSGGVAPTSGADITAAVLTRHLALHPYVRACLRVMVDRAAAPFVVDAVRAVVSKHGDLTVELHTPDPTTHPDLAAAISDGRVRLVPAAADLDTSRAHVYVRVARTMDTVEPGAGAALAGCLVATRRGTLGIGHDLTDRPCLAVAVEATGHSHSPLWWVEESVAPLRAATIELTTCDRTAWHVVMGSRLDRTTAGDSHLLASDRHANVDVRVVSALAETSELSLCAQLTRLGVAVTQGTASALGAALVAQGPGGLWGLLRSDEDALGLNLLCCYLAGDGVIAVAELGADLLGTRELDGVVAVAVLLTERGLALRAGWATARRLSDVVSDGRLVGDAAEALERAQALLRAATSSGRPGAVARAALCQLLAPSAARSASSRRLGEHVSRLADADLDQPCVLAAGLAPGHARLGRDRVELVGIDADLVGRLALRGAPS